MVCGLFSSFDPGTLYSGESSFFSTKWWTFILVLVFLTWQFFLLPMGVSLIHKNLTFQFLSGVSESFPRPQSVFVFLFSLFLMLLSANLWGLVPMSFSLTAHLSVNLSLSLLLWSGGVFLSIFSSVMVFLANTVPVGCPMFLWPLLVLVESVSVMIRPITLAIRLMANVMAGHLIMSLVGSFFSKVSFFFLLSLPTLGLFLTFEFCISCVQAYVFMSLLTLYWKESEGH